MKYREIIKAIQYLGKTEQYRLKEFFNQSLASIRIAAFKIKKLIRFGKKSRKEILGCMIKLNKECY